LATEIALRTGGDAEALERCRQGDEEGFRALLEAHQTYVFTLCWRMTGRREEAMDLTQEVFLKVIRALPRLQPRPSLRPWLRRVAVNLCLNQRQADKRRTALRGGLERGAQPEAGGTGGDPVGETVASLDRVDRIGELLRRLSPAQRSTLILSAVEDLSCNQIAGITGMPAGTVKSHLSRARARLRQALAEEGGTLEL